MRQAGRKKPHINGLIESSWCQKLAKWPCLVQKISAQKMGFAIVSRVPGILGQKCFTTSFFLAFFQDKRVTQLVEQFAQSVRPFQVTWPELSARLSCKCAAKL